MFSVTLRCALCFLALVLVKAQNRGDVKVVQVRQGSVSGEADYLLPNNQYAYSFKGIPYAKPPVDELRFKHPEEPEHFQGTFNARLSISCPQGKSFSRDYQFRGEEDCLTLDVYARSVNPNNYKPVVVYIPGGGHYRYAMASDYEPKHFLYQSGQDFVVVVISYRVGVLGFLSTQDDVIPGNLGLWDQQMALKWIRNNIEGFGGDKNKITIFGHDSGASSVSLHVLNRDSRAYFDQAIISGGSLYSPWAFQDEQPWRHAHDLAYRLKCPTKSRELLECLKTKQVTDIVKVQDEIMNITFRPVLDTNFTGIKSFFKDDPFRLLETGNFQKLPVLFGMVQNSGFIEYFTMLNELKNTKSDTEALSLYLQPYLFPRTIFNHDPLEAWERHQLSAVTKGIQYLYFRDVEVRRWDMSENYWIEFISDFLYRSGVNKLANYLSQGYNNNTFLYQTEIPSPYSFKKLANYINSYKEFGPIHMDDVLYLFDNSEWENAMRITDQNEQKRHENNRKEFMTLVTKFITDSKLELNKYSPLLPFNSTTIRFTNTTQNPYFVNENNYRVSKLEFFTSFVPDVVYHNNSIRYFDRQEDNAQYQSATWGLFSVLLIMAIALVILIFYTLKLKKSNKNKGFEQVATHVPGESVDFKQRV